ncbi:ribbon-helix-helix protein, CopG family [Patescibacteria group bacterium]|nr:ribbon-helix-helix protein, CopG family [Patescibacteria group bacterium]
MAKSPHLNIIISDQDKERLKKLAIVAERSMSQLAAIAIREYLDRYEKSASNTSTDKINIP